MITINEPERNFRDFDNFIRHLTCLETEQRRVQAMPKGETSIRSASQQASVHIWHPEYNVDIYFTKAYMSIFSFPYNLLKNMLIHSEDITGYDIDDLRVTIYLTDGAKYGFVNNEFTIDFYMIENSTPELLNQDMIAKHLSQGRRACYGIPA